MADFCKQCSIETYGVDCGDLASPDHPSEELHYYCICEGCGFTVVNKVGECIGDCLLHHGTLSIQVPSNLQGARFQ